MCLLAVSPAVHMDASDSYGHAVLEAKQDTGTAVRDRLSHIYEGSTVLKITGLSPKTQVAQQVSETLALLQVLPSHMVDCSCMVLLLVYHAWSRWSLDVHKSILLFLANELHKHLCNMVQHASWECAVCSARPVAPLLLQDIGHRSAKCMHHSCKIRCLTFVK